MLRPTDILFGEIAITLGFLTREQVAECIGVQRRKRGRTRIGRICEDKGYLSAAQVKRILTEQAALLERRG